MSSYLIVPGAIALPESTKARLKEQVKALDLAIDKIFTRFEYYVYSEEPLSEKQQAAVTEFLTRDIKVKDVQIAKHDVELRILPRLGTISPWASKATDLARNCGVEGVSRIERGIYMAVSPEKSFWSGSGLKEEQLQEFIKLIHDRMSQTVMVGDAFNPQVLFVDLEPQALRTVAILEEGASALEKANADWSLALSEDEVEYLVAAFIKLQRNPTDVELMMFAQANSEHCRHKIFNAAWTVDGEAKDKTLFGMVRDTHKNNPRGTVVAYADNAAIMEGAESTRFFAPKRPNGDFIYQGKKRLTHTLMKVETHNHPTAVAPFPGASTGSGGEIRDEGATGRGANPKAGLTGFTVGNLQIDNLKEQWEEDSHGKPSGITSALDIVIQGSLGGAEFNNEFGRANILGYLRSYEQTVGGRRWGYQKPIMIAGGLGSIDSELCFKDQIPVGALLIQLGGPGMLIGMGGGAASSMSSGSSSSAEALDFDSVQRANPEIERRAQEVINSCWQLFENNPIVAIHDVGAGGLSNAFPELVNDAERGAIFDLNLVPVEDTGMSAAEIWSNESQERYVLAIAPESLELFDEIARRERCPYAVVGIATEERVLRVVEGEGLPGQENSTSEQPATKLRPVDVPLEVILGKAPKMHRDVESVAVEVAPVDVVGLDLREVGLSVMRHPTVANKSFLITGTDRNVGGLTARDQLVGPWQIPVADCAVTLADYENFHGEAMSMGERSPLAIVDSAAASRMAIAESITNIAAADIKHLDGIKLSANWMAACGTPGQDAALYKAVQAASEFCQALDIAIPVGKDSMSMRTAWTEEGKDGPVQKEVTAPVSLVVTAFSQVEDVRKTLTPQLVTDQGPTSLILIDLGEGKQRLGGSVLTHTIGQFGNEVPDVEDTEKLRTFFAVIRSLADEGTVLAYHDRSDGGLFATVAEMAFAGHTGVSINVDMLTFDGAVQDWGDYKIRPEQVQVQRDESTIKALFNEELGAVIQVRTEDRDTVLQLLREVGLSLCSHAIGTLNDKDTIEVYRDGGVVLEYPRAELGAAWSEVSYEVSKLRDSPITAKAEFERWNDSNDAGLNAKVNFDPQEDIAAPYYNKGRPAVALIREQGLNSQVEMAWVLTKAGFTVHDVHMTDLLEGRVDLDDVQGLVASGGFTYGDVLGPGEGWAKTIRYNSKLLEQFTKFFDRDDVFALGVSNGCQLMTSLSDIIPGADYWPRFTKNKSTRHEARLLMAEVSDSNSILFKGMAGTQAPIVVSQDAGFANFSLHGDLDNVISAMRYVSNSGVITEAYPFNPSGSISGIAAVTTEDGRFTAMMPHPERTVRRAMMSWSPESWGSNDSGGDQTPWMRMFMNARVFLG